MGFGGGGDLGIHRTLRSWVCVVHDHGCVTFVTRVDLQYKSKIKAEKCRVFWIELSVQSKTILKIPLVFILKHREWVLNIRGDDY